MMTSIEKSPFKRLIGIWNTEGTILTDQDNSKLIGIDSYEFTLNSNYILHKADVRMGKEKVETIEIISIGDSTTKGRMHYFNSRGETGFMTSSFTANDFKIIGEKIKFEGSFNNENTKLEGKWYMETEPDKWTEFIDMKLTKQN